MRDPDDHSTSDAFDSDPGAEAQGQLPLDEAAKRIGLRRETVWVPTEQTADQQKARKRERQQRYRERQAEAGISQINVDAHESVQPVIKQIAQASARGESLSSILSGLVSPPAQPADSQPRDARPFDAELERVRETLEAGGWRAQLIRWLARRREIGI